MKKNVGMFDRIARVAIAVLIAVLYFANVISGTVAIVLLILAGIFIVTSFVGFCPIYYGLKISSRKRQQKEIHG
jgi:K+-transporting ATPase A subunit